MMVEVCLVLYNLCMVIMVSVVRVVLRKVVMVFKVEKFFVFVVFRCGDNIIRMLKKLMIIVF